MNERISQWVGQISHVWKQMSPKRRLVTGGVVGAVFLALLLLSFTLKPSARSEILFSHLAPTDTAAVLELLEERDIPYDLQQHIDGRSTILVPSSTVHRTRIDMAAVGIPRQGSVGFEIFDETQLGMTDDVRRIHLRRALNGELERTIRAMDVVQDARVQVALPENKLFISQQVDPTAAVMITLYPGARLARDQINAIQRLVSATIEGLNAENVFVVDNRGNPLSDQLARLDATNGISNVEQQILMQQAVSNEYTRQIRHLLEGPFGPGAVEAMVNVELNFERAEEIISAFEAPDGRTGIVRSEQRLDERFEGTNIVPGETGVPGVEANVPGYVGQVSEGDSEYSRTEEIINYEINQIETRREIPPGAVKRLSVAVLIDGDLNPDQKESVSNTLMSALGLNPERGDRVHVESLPFAKRPTMPEVLVDQRGLGKGWSESPLLALVIAGFLLLFFFIVWRTRRSEERPVQTEDRWIGEYEVAGTSEQELTPEERKSKHIHDQVLTAARKSPSDIAQLLKTWLLEE